MRPRYLLDTNTCIYILKGAPELVLARFAACSVGDTVMSAITYAELIYGAEISSSKDPVADKKAVIALTDAVPVEPLGAEIAQAYASIRKAAPGRTAGALDRLIAAHAVALGAIVVTNNEKDFLRYPGVQVENWLHH